jgi:lipid-A-disaccharide synthase-like uncharacterized protein
MPKIKPTEIQWKFKKDAEPQGGSDGFWYDLTMGGYIKLEHVLADKDQLKAATDAVALLSSLENAMIANELINEM